MCLRKSVVQLLSGERHQEVKFRNRNYLLVNEEMRCVRTCTKKHLQVNLFYRELFLMYSQADFIRGARWTKWLYYVRPAVKKSLWNCNHGLDYPTRLVHLDFNQQTLRFDIVHLRDDYLRVSWRFLVIPLRRLLCYHLLPFLYLVDLVLQLYLLSVKCKYFVSGYFIFTYNLQFQLFNTWTNCVSSHLSLAVNCNQLLTAAIWL